MILLWVYWGLWPCFWQSSEALDSACFWCCLRMEVGDAQGLTPTQSLGGGRSLGRTLHGANARFNCPHRMWRSYWDLYWSNSPYTISSNLRGRILTVILLRFMCRTIWLQILPSCISWRNQIGARHLLAWGQLRIGARQSCRSKIFAWSNYQLS